ncbi:MAG: ribosome small subunit-dependent GTPase A [Actinomycetota bacterium]|nr:ribosome small subunit-dependent GTPase A [Actinomycetota bacterium]
MNLHDLGWDPSFDDAFEPYRRDNLIPARVAARHHGPCELLTELGRLGGIPAGSLDDGELPAVGDWVAARPLAGERKAVIQAVLPRRSAFTRKEAWRRTAEQVVAANVDTVFLVTAFGGDLNPRRLERYLTAAWDGGANPVIVVNKSDIADDVRAELAEIESVAFGVPVHAVSAATGNGLESLEPHLGRGRTVALLGSSGVGKSTLVNRLAGRELLATAETSADGRGRHTTSHRELVLLPDGALLLDTPGMRELQLWVDADALDTTFAEITELAAGCRFNDCSHEHEPGCAVRAALADGTLSRERLRSYRKLQRELRALEVRKDARLRAEARKEIRRFSRSVRKKQRR